MRNYFSVLATPFLSTLSKPYTTTIGSKSKCDYDQEMSQLTKLQTHPGHRDEETQKYRQPQEPSKQGNKLSLPTQGDFRTKMGISKYTTKRTNTKHPHTMRATTSNEPIKKDYPSVARVRDVILHSRLRHLDRSKITIINNNPEKYGFFS